MPLESMSTESGQLIEYLLQALWFVAGLCGVVVTAALGFFLLTARAIKHSPPVLPESHQFGVAKAAAAGPNKTIDFKGTECYS